MRKRRPLYPDTLDEITAGCTTAGEIAADGLPDLITGVIWDTSDPSQPHLDAYYVECRTHALQAVAEMEPEEATEQGWMLTEALFICDRCEQESVTD